MAYDVEMAAVEPVVDGMIDLLRVNLVANTWLTQDAHVGDTVLSVDNSRRFRKFDHVLLMDNNSSRTDTSGELVGVEFNRVSSDFEGTGTLRIAEPLQKDFLVADNGRLQKTIKKAILYEKDVLYGDRQVISSEGVAICVEPESHSQEWLAVRLLGHDIRLAILVYVKCGGLGDEEEYAMRVCNAYADAITKTLMGNIHLDISIAEARLVRDAREGDSGVYVDCDVAADWQPDMECLDFEVQDNWGANQLLRIVDDGDESSSSTSSPSSSAVGLSSTSSSSSPSSLSSASGSSSSSSPSSSSSWSSASITLPDSSSATSESSSLSSQSTATTEAEPGCWVRLDRPLTRDFLVQDKAAIRKKKRYTYDSRVKNVEYGMVQKGSVFMKAARLSWFGKEAEAFQFPQPGVGRQA